MKFNLTTVLILFLTALSGWFLGFIKVPYVKYGNTFWLGFFGGLVFISFAFFLFYYWRNKKLSFLFEFSRESNKESTNQVVKNGKIGLFILSVCFLIVVCIGYSVDSRKEKKLYLLEAELKELKNQANLEDQRSKIDLLLKVMNVLDSVKANTIDSSILQSRINRIIALSSAFKVQKQWDPENRSYRELSSMRGMLLLAILNSNLDSASFQKIKDQISFSYADLRNADLRGLNLRGIDLNYANLEQANLEGAHLDYAGLRGANLTSANLNQSTLVETNLISAKLNWAKVNEAQLNHARLDSANFSNASICKSNLKYATYIQTVMSYAQVQESDLSNGFFIGTDFTYANLSKSNLKNPDFRKANLIGTILNKAIIQDDWIELLSKEPNEGVQEILKNYHVIRDSAAIKDSIIVRLETKNH